MFPIDHPVLARSVVHAADTYSKHHVNKDGKTPYEKIKGKPCKEVKVEFGETILYKLPGRGPAGPATAQPRWFTGTWLGKRRESGEHWVALPNGDVIKARAITRRSLDSRWMVSTARFVKGTPWEPKPGGSREARDEPMPAEASGPTATEPLEAPEPVPRDF